MGVLPLGTSWGGGAWLGQRVACLDGMCLVEWGKGGYAAVVVVVVVVVVVFGGLACACCVCTLACPTVCCCCCHCGGGCCGQDHPSWVVGKNVYLTSKAPKPTSNQLDPRGVAQW